MQFETAQFLPVIFVLIICATVYCMMRVFTFIDPERFQKNRLLGLFALLIPGVLKEGGATAFLTMIAVAIATFLFGLYLFEF